MFVIVVAAEKDEIMNTDGEREQRRQPVDQRDQLAEEVFTFHAAKDGRVLLYWYGKLVKTLAGAEAQKFLKRIDGLEGRDAQLVMAKVTGNFRRGNERRVSK